MTILYLAHARLPTEKAHGLQIMKMCEALAQGGASVELIVPYRVNSIHEDPFDYWRIARSFSIHVLGSFDFMSIRFLPRFVAFWCNALSFTLLAFLHIRSRKDDAVIYARDREVALLTLCIAQPMVFEVHFLPEPLGLYRPLLRRMKKIITITQHAEAILIRQGIAREKISVLPDAVDLSRFAFQTSREELRKELGMPLERHVALYAGQLFAWKGIKTLLEASRKLPPDCETVIIGGSSEEIRRLSEMSDGRALFFGQRKSEDVPRFLKAADVLVLPNSGRFAISRHYTSPLKLFEYMAAGVPIVSSDLPSLREILTDEDAVFFKPDDAHDLARAIQEVLQDTEKGKMLAMRARKKVEEYTWDRRAARIIALLKI